MKEKTKNDKARVPFYLVLLMFLLVATFITSVISSNLVAIFMCFMVSIVLNMINIANIVDVKPERSTAFTGVCLVGSLLTYVFLLANLLIRCVFTELPVDYKETSLAQTCKLLKHAVKNDVK